MKNLEKNSTIAKEIAKEYFGGIISNLDDMLSEIKFESTTKSSNFDYKTKTVFINMHFTQDVNHFVHELFHAISTNYYSNGVHIGFNNIEFKDFNNDYIFETNYGYALNEGATHSFTRDATNNRFGEINPISSYNFCANIYKNLENYAGKDTMKFLYSNYGTKKFIDVMAEKFHTSKENVLKLVLSMDSYLDTYRIYSVFFKNFESADASSLLSNCYTYLFKIIGDKLAFEGKNFNKTNISTKHLSSDEMVLFNNAVNRIENKDLISNASNLSIEEFEDMAYKIYTKEFNNELTTLDIANNLKNAQFYNFLFLNNYICSKNRIRKDILKADLNASLTKKLFSENFKALNIDSDLPDNIRTLLSLRFVIRANCSTSDFYMKKCLNNKKFTEYLKNTDSDYYNSLINNEKNLID